MKPALCAILFTALAVSNSEAGYVAGEINLSTGSGPLGSLGTVGSGSGAMLVGTNLAAPSITPLSGGVVSAVPLQGSYLDFQTGTYTGTDGMGHTYYGPGGNFFILAGTLQQAAGTSPIASSLTTGPATVTALGNGQFELTMSFTGGYLSEPVAQEFGTSFVPLAMGRIYSGTLDFIFVVNSSLAGNQLISGGIYFNSTAVPEPSSLALVTLGGFGVLGYGRRRLKRRAA